MNNTFAEKEVTLLDALDRVIENGAVISGDLTLKMADIDLIYIGLRLIATSVSKVESMNGSSHQCPDREPTEHESNYIQKLDSEIIKAEQNISQLIELQNPEKTEQGLAQIVLTLVVLLKRLMEREAMRRIQRGALSNVAIQKLGLTFMALDKKVDELKCVFGLKDDDLNIDLGPLGNLM